MEKVYSESQQTLIRLAEEHVSAEFLKDVDGTMATMGSNPHLFAVPAMQVAEGSEEVRSFYSNFLPGKFFPPDTDLILVSRTVGNTQLIDENIIKFTHTIEVGWMLPGLAPTGKRVEIPMIVIFKFADGKLAHEHLYWDQASVLVQLGLLDPEGLPVQGLEAAKQMAQFL
jgi:carboxymethylenebutenolidase